MTANARTTGDQAQAAGHLEFTRQVETLLAKGYPALAGMDERRLLARLEPLRTQIDHVFTTRDDAFPFVIVVPGRIVPTLDAVGRFDVRGTAGWTDMAEELDSYRPIAGLDLPKGDAYLLVDVHTGADTLNIAPRDALPLVTRAGRSPLTIDEGVALVTQFPEVLTRHNAFQALGSRSTNKRVPTFWISKGAPRLGWCWEGNPHTWLGAASAGARLGP